MKVMAGFALFAALACSTAGNSMKPVAQGSYAKSQAAQPRAEVAFDQESYRTLWDALIGEGEPPAVDFTKNAAVFLLAGQRSTGGYSVAPRGVAVEGEELVVDAAVQAPPAGSMTTQAFTSPWTVVVVGRRDFKRVRWNPS